MSWRKIEKVWDDVRSAQQPKRNLSKQTREVKLTSTEDFQDTISIAFDNEVLIEEYDAMLSEIESFISRNRQRLQDLVGYVAPWDSLSDKIRKQQESIDKARESLGLDYTDLGMDYDSGDIIEAIRIFATLRGKDEELMDSFSDLKKFISDFE